MPASPARPCSRPRRNWACDSFPRAQVETCERLLVGKIPLRDLDLLGSCVDFLAASSEMMLTKDQRLHFLGEFRSARLAVLEDAEAVDAILFVLERLGCHLLGVTGNLGRYQPKLEELASFSPLSFGDGLELRAWHTPFREQYDIVRKGRNDAMHQGVYARSLAQHSLLLALTLEDALAAEFMNVSDLMIRQPVCAELWQPVSFVRQTMLVHSFSSLPVIYNDEWKLITDGEVVRYLRGSLDPTDRKARLARSLEAAVGLNPSEGERLRLTEPRILQPDDRIDTVAANFVSAMALVLANPSSGQRFSPLIGILTPFDLL